MKKTRVFLLLLLPLLAQTVFGAVEGKISGYFFGDYYNVFSHSNADLKGQNGFWIRRTYFTYDAKFNDHWKARIRFETNSPGDFKTQTVTTPFLKDASISYTTGNHTLSFGLIPTPIYDKTDEYWGYRAIEKSPIDLYKYGSARDFGVSLSGSFDAAKKIQYTLVLDNGSATKSEIDKGKQVIARLAFLPAEPIYLEFYADNTHIAKNSNTNVYQIFAVYKKKGGRLGLTYGTKRSKAGDAKAATLSFFSAFGVLRLQEKLDFILRYDRHMDPNPNGAKIDYIPFNTTAKSNFILTGFGWRVNENVTLMPNVKVVVYDKPATGDKPKSDIYGAMTFYCTF
jgi:hypothetical protein